MPFSVWYSRHVPCRGCRRRTGVDDLRRPAAADRKGVADDGPLRLAEQAQHLAEVVDEAGEDEPARLAVGANGLGRLQRVLDLGEVDVGIAVVDQRVEVLQRLQHRHRPAVQRQVVALLPEDEVERLVRVVQAVELRDPLVGVLVVAELVDRLRQQRTAGLACLHGAPRKILTQGGSSPLFRGVSFLQEGRSSGVHKFSYRRSGGQPRPEYSRAIHTALRRGVATPGR